MGKRRERTYLFCVGERGPIVEKKKKEKKKMKRKRKRRGCRKKGEEKRGKKEGRIVCFFLRG